MPVAASLQAGRRQQRHTEASLRIAMSLCMRWRLSLTDPSPVNYLRAHDDTRHTNQRPLRRGRRRHRRRGAIWSVRSRPWPGLPAASGLSAGLGGFGGLFDLAACGFRDPMLVATTDGVGTKVLLAAEAGAHHAIGIDLVAMCVNDLVVQGAAAAVLPRLLRHRPARCRPWRGSGGRDRRWLPVAGCALIGGETAEMPGLYGRGEFDLAGFAVGAVERDAVLPRPDRIVDGDLVLGLASSGIHANGFSLVRLVLREQGLGLADACPGKRAASRRRAAGADANLRREPASPPSPPAGSRRWRTSPAAASSKIRRACWAKVRSCGSMPGPGPAAGVRMAGPSRQARRHGAAADLQLRYRHDRSWSIRAGRCGALARCRLRRNGAHDRHDGRGRGQATGRVHGLEAAWPAVASPS